MVCAGGGSGRGGVLFQVGVGVGFAVPMVLAFPVVVVEI